MDNKEIKTYLKKSLFSGYGKSFFSILGPLILIPLIIKKIGMDGYGYVSITLIFSSLSGIVDLGLSKTVVVLINKEKNEERYNSIFSSALFLNLLIITILILVIILAKMLNPSIFESNMQMPRYEQNLVLFCSLLILCLTILTNLFRSVLEAFFKIHYVNMGFAVSSLLLFGLIYVVSIFTNSLQILVLTPLFSSFLILLLHLAFVFKLTPIKIQKISYQDVIRIARLSVSFVGIGLVSAMVLPINRLLFVTFNGNVAEYGIFDVALRIAMAANNLLVVLAVPLFAVFSKMNFKNRMKIKIISQKVSLLLFLMYLSGCAFFYYLGLYLSSFFDAANKLDLYRMTMILLLGICFSGVSEPFNRAMWGIGWLNKSLYLKAIIPILNFSILAYIGTSFSIQQLVDVYSFSVFASSLAIILYFNSLNCLKE